MLTNIEIETLTLIKSACKSIINRLEENNNVDWEQRRYEIAKSVSHRYLSLPPREAATFAVDYADALIAELKKKK